jgi:hypothetical protein
MRYFRVTVNHFAATVSEEFAPLKSYDWAGAIDGVSVQYKIEKECKGNVKNWFERGTAETQYHARNISKTGFVAWQTMSKAPRRQNKKEAQIKAKMKELL